MPLVSEQSPSFPVFNVRPPAQSAEKIEDPQHVADRDPDELEREVATEGPDPLSMLPSGAAYVLTPRSTAQTRRSTPYARRVC
jgi:hypothetical protein